MRVCIEHQLFTGNAGHSDGRQMVEEATSRILADLLSVCREELNGERTEVTLRFTIEFSPDRRLA